MKAVWRPSRRPPRGRLFDYGDLRLVVLDMIVEQPRHGYELIRAIEERMGGSYSPSPGVIYPTLSWLEDMGYAAVETEDGGRKRYNVTPEGKAFLAANRAALDALLSAHRFGPQGRPLRRRTGPDPARHGEPEARAETAASQPADRPGRGGKYRSRTRCRCAERRAELNTSSPRP